MFGIDNKTAVADMPTPAPPGVEGWFTGGVPGSQAATQIDADWLNRVTAELRNVLVVAGIAPAKAVFNQVVTAIQALISAASATLLAEIESAVQAQTWIFALDGSSAPNSYNIDLTPSDATPVVGTRVSVLIRAGNTNTGVSSLNVNAGPAYSIKKHSAGSLADTIAGDLVAGHIYDFTFDGTVWQLMTPVG